MRNPCQLPPSVGIGLRAPHVAQVRSERPDTGWLEVHSENYFVDGGPALTALDAIRADYPVSLHGVGMSLGSCDALDNTDLASLAMCARSSGSADPSDMPTPCSEIG